MREMVCVRPVCVVVASQRPIVVTADVLFFQPEDEDAETTLCLSFTTWIFPFICDGERESFPFTHMMFVSLTNFLQDNKV